jgi:integrase
MTTATLPLRHGAIALPDLIDLYMANYAGRDTARVQRLSWWKARLGGITLEGLSDDQVHASLEALSTEPTRYFAGKDAAGQPIYKAKKKPMAPATVNRYAASLAAVITWAIKKRIAPKGYVHPCRTVERKPENNERVRFLSPDERERLLDACRRARWPKLYLLVLMALTTGARKGELLALQWEDVDLDRAEAHCGRSKNGDPKVLPLVPAVVQLLQAFRGAPSALVFGSPRDGGQPFAFEGQWAEALKKAHIRRFRFHDLRHSCASMLAASGATLLEIADVLGHRQLAMTKRYSHLTTQHKATLVNRVLGTIGSEVG